MNQRFVIFFLLVALPGLVLRCQPLPDPLTAYTLIGAEQPGTVRAAATGCGFRYAFVNSFARLDDQSQRLAMRTGIELWTNRCPNLRLLEFTDVSRADLRIQFVELGATTFSTAIPTQGLVRTARPTVSALRRNADGSHTILLDNAYNWTIESLTKAITYQTGLFLGMKVSADEQSVMSPIYSGPVPAPASADSVRLNQFYPGPCRDLTVTYLPSTFPVNAPVLKTIRPERGGRVLVTATGNINVGIFVGSSGPNGTKGPLDLPVDFFNQYSIDPNMLHACLIYRLNSDPVWKYCGKECQIDLSNARYTDLMFNINDRNLSDNSGAYSVTVQEL